MDVILFTVKYITIEYEIDLQSYSHNNLLRVLLMDIFNSITSPWDYYSTRRDLRVVKVILSGEFSRMTDALK